MVSLDKMRSQKDGNDVAVLGTCELGVGRRLKQGKDISVRSEC